MKPTLGVFSFSGCSGCQLELIHQEDILLDLLSKVKVVYFPMLLEKNERQPVDVAIVEGSVSSDRHVEALRQIRGMSRYLIAIGACAILGGVNALRNPMNKAAVERYVYGTKPPVASISAERVDKYVPVDFYLRGCPPDKEEFTRTLKSLLLGSKPFVYAQPVCSECRIQENLCLLKAGSLCLGPVTYGGCGAICPGNGLACDGCRGELADGNQKALADCLEENGIPKKELKRKMDIFNTAGPGK